MSNLSELLPTGGGQNAVDFVASGTLASGQTVALKSNGQVEAVGQTAESIGTETEFQSGRCDYTDAVYDVNANKIVIFYNLNNGGPYGVVGTVSGSSISFGTPVNTGQGQIYSTLGAVYDSTNNKVLYGFRIGSAGGVKVIVGTVSGTSISFGTATSIDNGSNETGGTMAYDATAQKLVVNYPSANNSQYGASVIGTVSGTSISFGTPVVYTSSAINTGVGTGTVYDPVSQKVLLGYRDNSVARGYGIVGTVSGTSISFGTAVKYSGDNVTAGMKFGYSTSASKILIVYENENTNDGLALTATISGTSVSYGTSLLWVSNGFKLGAVNTVALNEDTNANLMVLGFTNNSSQGQVISFSISGTTVTAATSITTWDAGTQTYYIGGAYHTVEKKTIFSWGQSFSTGEAITYSPSFTNLSATTFIGITSEAISNTATGAVNVYGGINTVQTGLTIASDYYVQADGRLASGVEYAPYSISGAAYSNRSFSIASQETVPAGLAFNSTGTKMFIVGSANDTVFQYSLSAAYDISSASYDSVSFSVSAQDTTPYGLAFNPTGTKMFIVGSANDAVFQYSLSSAFDLSSASYDSVTLNISAQTTGPFDITFNNDGTKFYIANATGLTVLQYSMSSAYNLATASYDSVSFSTSSQDSNSPRSVAFNGDGTKMFITGQASNAVYQYSLSSAFNVSTASYDSINFSVTAQGETNLNSVIFNSSGTAFYALGFQLDTVLEYATTALAYVTTVKAGQAVSATTINMKDLT